MQLVTGAEVVGLSLHLRNLQTIIFGDLHIGLEQTQIQSGFHILRKQQQTLIASLQTCLSKTAPKRIVFLGDIQHNFGKLHDSDWANTKQIIDLCRKFGEPIFIKGNHDTTIKYLVKKFSVQFVESLMIDSFYLCHGHLVPEENSCKSVRTIIIGHQHPAVTLHDAMRKETYKCFLRGPYKKKEVIVLPSLNEQPIGTDILTTRMISPFLKEINTFEVFAVEHDQILPLGNVKGLKNRII